MEQNYDLQIQQAAEQIFNLMEAKVSPEKLRMIKHAFQIAKEGHSKQFRRSGEPYILHPLSVALIAAKDMQLDANAVTASLLHDLVEDTEYKIDFVEKEFGSDVAFLVKALTKEKKEHYEISLQVENYQRMLGSLNYDLRAIMVKLADRLHNLRTLESMPVQKRWKIASESQIFFAPLANRLGLYQIKVEMENLGFKYRCPVEYNKLEKQLEKYKKDNAVVIETFVNEIKDILAANHEEARVEVVYRKPYSIWRKMVKDSIDFQHVTNRHYVKIIFPDGQNRTEKNIALCIYSILTDKFIEKPRSVINYLDSPKLNGYESYHFKLLADHGKWVELHLCSERMVRNSRLGCMSSQSASSIKDWLKKFKEVLQDINIHGFQSDYIGSIGSSLYNDDILVFTPKGEPVRLPKGATALDFAFEIHSKLGLHAKYAMINDRLCSVKTVLRRGDSISIGQEETVHPEANWLDHVITYKAKSHISSYLTKKPVSAYHRCEHCRPIPGEEVIGFKEADGSITIHKRNCPDAIRLASQYGDSIVNIDFEEEENILYPIAIHVKAIDRYHLLSDIIDCITNELGLSIESLHTATEDFIVDCTIKFAIHSFEELNTITTHLYDIEGVDEVCNEELK